MSNLKELLKNRYLDTVRSVKPATRYKIVVVDSTSVKLLSAACKMYDILEENVTLVENIEKKRQPFTNLEALYILTPSVESVFLLIQDLTNGGPGGKPGSMYAAAHVFFTHALDDMLVNKITSSKAAPLIQNLKELFVDMNVFESKVFTVSMPNAFYSIFGPSHAGMENDLTLVADRLVSFCSTIGENPIIRYHRPGAEPNSFNHTMVPSRLANILQQKMDEFCHVSKGAFPPKREGNPPRAVMYVLDRSVDLVAPLVHEFTYQAMANDLLPIEDGVKFLHEFASGSGETASKEVLLDESDTIWADIRHAHIAECSGKLIADFKKLVGENKAAASMNKTDASLGDMKRILADLPQFQELKAKYSVHISLAQECMNLFERQKLPMIGEVEQDMACRETPEGEYPKKLVERLLPLLDDSTISESNKLRLIMQYVLYKNGLRWEDRYRLQQHANLSAKDVECIENLELLHTRVNKSGNKGIKNIRMPKMGRKKVEDVPYELSRYTPEIKKILEAQANGTVNDAEFPYTREVRPSELNEQAKKTVQSLRSTKPSWQKSAQERSEAKPVTGGRLIVFVAGGITYSEMRSVYEVGQKYGRDVLIGSTHIITPKQFMHDLCRLRDGPPKEIPPPPPPPPKHNMPISPGVPHSAPGLAGHMENMHIHDGQHHAGGSKHKHGSSGGGGKHVFGLFGKKK
ncbi:Sec1-like protein [Thamnocephalis sphaerospora]|uniref:Sec1-like protein n=1 Tax=Thamnocephalis sphaerospora TaxID=78915 RepID=A0A4P9XU39_9FUNG|nr:Sec1-like protein [Thamnocephalis sphaerospora]|eukprot:RKP09734.1 Sec1-like protein [Thamnocephalis sphaerospora]